MNENLARPTRAHRHWLETWRPTVPAAALGWMWLVSACWGQEPGWVAGSIVAGGGWGLAVLSRAAENREPASPAAAWLAVLVCAAAIALSIWRQPRALMLTNAGLGCLAAFQLVICAGSGRSLIMRVALLMAGIIGAAVIWTAPVQWSLITRVAAVAILLFSAVHLAHTPPTRVVLDLPLGLMRGVLFAAAVLAPTSWYASGGVAAELIRFENLVFLAVATLAAVTVQARAGNDSPGRPSPGEGIIGLVVPGALMLIATAAALTATQRAPRPLFWAASVAALALTIAAVLNRRQSSASAFLRECSMLAPWLVLPFVPWIVQRLN